MFDINILYTTQCRMFDYPNIMKGFFGIRVKKKKNTSLKFLNVTSVRLDGK